MQKVETHIVCDVCGQEAHHKVKLAVIPKGVITVDLCTHHGGPVVELYGSLRRKPRRSKTMAGVKQLSDVTELHPEGKGKTRTPPQRRSLPSQTAAEVSRG